MRLVWQLCKSIKIYLGISLIFVSLSTHTFSWIDKSSDIDRSNDGVIFRHIHRAHLRCMETYYNVPAFLEYHMAKE